MSKKCFKVPVEWMVCDFVEIEAENFKEAIKYVLENKDSLPLGKNPEYIDGTYKINGEDSVIGNEESDEYLNNLVQELETYGYWGIKYV